MGAVAVANDVTSHRLIDEEDVSDLKKNQIYKESLVGTLVYLRIQNLPPALDIGTTESLAQPLINSGNLFCF